MTKTRVFHVRLSEDERKALKKKAADAGFETLADWVRSLAQTEEKVYHSQEAVIQPVTQPKPTNGLCPRCSRLGLSGCKNCVGEGKVRYD